MQFGFTLKPEHSIERTLALTRQAEAAGFAYGWLFDSHVLWRDPYPLLTLMAEATERLRLGTCVTNPARASRASRRPRLATLDELSGGRMDLGIGRGDSARRVLGKPPTTMATLEEAIRVIRALVEGRDDRRTRAPSCTSRGRRAGTLPVWVAGYGPMALAMTGRVADGVILQLADPDLIRWFVGQVREAEAAAGRPAGLRPGPGRGAGPRRRPRDVPRADALVPGARVSNHVVDLVNKYPREQLPESLTGYIRDREGYDYLHHAEVGSSNAGVRRRRGDRPVLRPRLGRRPRRQAARAADAGVDQFNIYLMNGDEEASSRPTAGRSSRSSRPRRPAPGEGPDAAPDRRPSRPVRSRTAGRTADVRSGAVALRVRWSERVTGADESPTRTMSRIPRHRRRCSPCLDCPCRAAATTRYWDRRRQERPPLRSRSDSSSGTPCGSRSRSSSSRLRWSTRPRRRSTAGRS